MSATNYDLALVARFWALLLARAAVAATVRERNRIRIDTAVERWPFKKSWNDGDFPELTVGYPMLTDSMLLARTYDTGRTTFNPATSPLPEILDYTVPIEIVHETLMLTEAGQLTGEVMSAIRAGGPKLALVNNVVTPLPFNVHSVGPIRVENMVVTRRVGQTANAGGGPLLASHRFCPLGVLPF